MIIIIIQEQRMIIPLAQIAAAESGFHLVTCSEDLQTTHQSVGIAPSQARTSLHAFIHTLCIELTEYT